MIDRNGFKGGRRYGLRDFRYLALDQASVSRQRYHNATLRLAGFKYLIRPRDLMERAIRVFGLDRLREIKQLAYIHEAYREGGRAKTYPHTRYQHVCDTAALATLMGRNVKLDEIEMEVLRLAAITHDALTPAGGDMVKEFDDGAFDEDAHYEWLLQRFDWSSIRSKYKIPRVQLIETVQGLGRLGALLDIADKIAYISRDTAMFLKGDSSGSPFDKRIRTLVKLRPAICAWWDSVALDGSRVYVRDLETLGDFLELRVLMFREVYYGDRTKFLRLFMSPILEYFYETKLLSGGQLLRQDDRDLDQLIGGLTGLALNCFDGRMGNPNVEYHDTLESAHARVVELLEIGNPFSVVREIGKFIKPASHFLVDDGGGIVSYREARPDRAAEIELLSKPQPPVRLYYLEGARTNLEITKTLVKHRWSSIVSQPA